MDTGGSSPVRKAGRLLVGAMLSLAFCSTAVAVTYTESVNGEISGNRLSPTFLQLDFSPSGEVPGSNVITGTLGRTGSVVDRDYLWINVPSGFVLSELRVGNQTTVGGPGSSFIALASGNTMPVVDSALTASGLLGYRLYTLADRNSDILDDMAVPLNGSSGFPRPLAAGDYTFWMQELAPGTYTYRFNMVLTPIPLPAGVWLLGAGLLALASVARRRHAR